VLKGGDIRKERRERGGNITYEARNSWENNPLMVLSGRRGGTHHKRLGGAMGEGGGELHSGHVQGKKISNSYREKGIGQGDDGKRQNMT